MNPPGWYPDPAGTPGSFRWWDGQAWTSATTQTPTTTPPPQNGTPPSGNAPGGPNRQKIIIGLTATGAALLLIVTGVIVIPRIAGGSAETIPTAAATTAAPPPTPTAAPTTAGSTAPPPPDTSPAGSGELDCAGGNQNTTGSKSPIYSSGGLQYEAPDDWGFRYDMSQWTWLDDQAVWGTLEIEPEQEEWAAGVALGGVQVANGFTDPDTAAEGLVTCLTRYGFANDGSWKFTEESSEDVTVGDLTGHRAVYLLTDGSNRSYPGYQVVALVLDTGREGSFGTWMSFGPKGEPTTGAQIEAAEKTITGN